MWNDPDFVRQEIVQPVLDSLNITDKNEAALTLTLMLSENVLNNQGHAYLSSSEHRHLWDDILAKSSDTASIVRGWASQHQFLIDPDKELIRNKSYATAIVAISVHHLNANPSKQTLIEKWCAAHPFWKNQARHLSQRLQTLTSI